MNAVPNNKIVYPIGYNIILAPKIMCTLHKWAYAYFSTGCSKGLLGVQCTELVCNMENCKLTMYSTADSQSKIKVKLSASFPLYSQSTI